MPIKRPPLVNNEIYHIVLRGVGDTVIFNNDGDRYRGIFSLYEFNTASPIEIRRQREKRKALKARGEQFSADTRSLLVEIFAFSFMPNHIHLLARQVKDKGITQFMRKLGAGYAAYFNKKYNRKGHLFQGRFRAIRIKDNQQLITVFVYIHANPISLIEPKWKELGIKSPKKVLNFLENYRWSSYPDYIGEKNFPSVTKRDFLTELIGGKEKRRELMRNRVLYKKQLKGLDEVALE